jgi:hypothetical protein
MRISRRRPLKIYLPCTMALLAFPVASNAQQAGGPPLGRESAATAMNGGAGWRPPLAEDLALLRDIGGPARGAVSVSPNGRWVAFQLHEPDLGSNQIQLTWLAVRTWGSNFGLSGEAIEPHEQDARGRATPASSHASPVGLDNNRTNS